MFDIRITKRPISSGRIAMKAELIKNGIADETITLLLIEEVMPDGVFRGYIDRVLDMFKKEIKVQLSIEDDR